MKMVLSKRKYMVLALLAAGLSFTACKKNKVVPEGNQGDPVPDSRTTYTPTTNRVELSNDSLFFYAKEIYFWNQSLPTYDAFNPRQYKGLSTDILNYRNNLFNIVKSSGSPDYLGGASSTRSKYSRIDVVADQNPAVFANAPGAQASVDLEGNGNDVGIFDVTGVQVDDTNYKLFILAVSPNSPAAKLGLTRGAYLTKINGTSIGSVANFTNESRVFSAMIVNNPSSVNVEGVRTDGSTFSATLTKTPYKSSPVFKNNVLTAGAKKIGYLAYAQFSNSDNSNDALKAVFDDFVAKGVTDLVIDLRYNLGGYVETADYLINLIAPSSVKGTTMYAEYYNQNLQNRKLSDKSILSNQPLTNDDGSVRRSNTGRILTYADVDYSVSGNTKTFSKTAGPANIQNVVFLVSGNTASASELVINTLKPKMNVKLVGSTTYGKPVGFSAVRLENKYDVYYAMFQSKNSLGQGDYFNGFTVDVPGGNDLGNYDFGNPKDGFLAKALTILSPDVSAANISSVNKVMSAGAGLGNASAIKVLGSSSRSKEGVGMIETRHPIRN